MTSSVAARTASNRPAARGASPAWRSSTSDIVWRVTSPPWPQPASSSWVSSGNVGREGRRLGVEVHLRLPPVGRHGGHAGGAVDERDGAPEPARQLGRRRRPAPAGRRAAGPAPPRPPSHRRACSPARSPARASATSSGTVVAPGAARPRAAPAAPRAPTRAPRQPGVGGQARPARRRARPRRPPPCAPRSTAFSAAVSVSAVPPEDETARTSVSASDEGRDARTRGRPRTAPPGRAP